MKFRRRRKVRCVPKRAAGFYVEDDDLYYEDVSMVGSLMSDWGPSDTPRSWPWNRKSEPKKPAFGFSRALED